MVWNNDDFIEALYKKEYRTLIRIAYRLTGSMECAQDSVHETFLLAIFHQRELRTHPKPGAWLKVALRNVICNERRLKAREDVPLDDAFSIPTQPAAPLGDLLPSQLQAEERQILIWRFEEQLSYQEMAKRLGISETLCRKRVSRAIARCRRLLTDGGV